MSPDWIRAALRSTPVPEQPDRTAILARIERGKAALEQPRASRGSHRRTAVRAVGIPVTVAAALGFSVAVTWAAVGTNVLQRFPNEPAVAPAPAVSSSRFPPAPLVTSRAPSPSHESSPASSPASPHSPARSSVQAAQQGFLRSSGAIDKVSIDNWSQGDVTLVNGKPVTALEVTVRVATTPDLSSSGMWSTIPAADLTTTVEQQPDALVYRFTLKAGVTLGVGSYKFAVEYHQAVGGRSPSRDTYRAVATAGDTHVEVNGGF